jgi:DNA-binding SARP family transcriptional activator
MAPTQRIFRLQLIGQFGLFRDPAGTAAIPKGRATTLLALLAAHRNHVVGNDLIATALWPPAGTPNALRLVPSLVSRLRRSVGPDLERLDDGYRLNTHGWEVDVDAAERFVRTAERHLLVDEPGLAHAAATRGMSMLGTGEPLIGHQSLPGVDDLRLTVEALLRRARRAAWLSALDLRDFRPAWEAAAAATRSNPLDEQAQRALMLTHYLLGERNDALRVYARLQDTLREDLGSDPDPQTQRLHLRILRGEAALGSPRGRGAASRRTESRSALPSRAETSAELHRAWGAGTVGDPKVVVITGAVGVGKSETLEGLTDHVASTGGVVLRGRCAGFARSLSLHPLAQAVRRLCARERPDLVREAATGVEAPLVALVPALAGVLDVRSVGRPGPVHEQRLVDAVHSFVLGLSAQHPVLVAIDDAHLADRHTLDVLHRLSEPGQGHRILVALTAPDGDLETVARALADREWLIRLEPFSARDVAVLAEQARVPDAAAKVYALTGGLPGLVAAALALREPAQCQTAAALDHLRRAGEDVVRLLTLAAVAGRQFRFDDVVRLGLPPAEATTAMQQATSAGLLAVRGEELAFTSELVYAAVRGALPEPVRNGVARCLRPEGSLDGLQPAS